MEVSHTQLRKNEFRGKFDLTAEAFSLFSRTQQYNIAGEHNIQKHVHIYMVV